jgi:hypothetical protein
MCEYVDDREYIQPECETIDWVVYAEYIQCQLRGISQDMRDAQSGQSRQDG